MPIVCLLFRKPVPLFFSIERIFDQLSPVLGKGAEIDKVYLPHSFSPLNLFRNLLFAGRQKADLYHVTGDIHYIVRALPRRRTILTIHDCVFLHRSRGLKRRILKWLFLDMPVRHCCLITTISEATRQDILRHTNCSPDKVVVIPNPVDSHIKYSPAEFNCRMPNVLFIGSTPNKNLERVIEALKGIDCTLTVVGRLSDPQLSLLQRTQVQYINRLNLSNEELIRQYVESDLVLFPSTFEGFGLPIVEGQATGRPVITSDRSPMKDVAGGGACLVDPDSIDSIRQGLLSVIRDAAFREQLVEKGLQNAGRFSAGAIAGQYEKVYQKIVSEL
jgi:glycosyltransferase involved in cell wall biosynthesis